MRPPDRLMTYNVKYGEKLPMIIEWLGDMPLNQRPHIACFQEFPNPYTNHLSGKLEQMGFTLRFGSAIEKKDGVFGQLTAVGLNGEIVNAQEIDFGLNPLERHLFGVSGRRSALLTDITTANDRSIQVANGHWPLLATYDQRKACTMQVVGSMDIDKPAIVAGDFNNIHLLRTRGRNRLRADLGNEGFKDAGLDKVTFPWIISHQLDYVFGRGVEVRNHRVLDVNMSDHKPVMVDIY